MDTCKLFAILHRESHEKILDWSPLATILLGLGATSIVYLHVGSLTDVGEIHFAANLILAIGVVATSLGTALALAMQRQARLQQARMAEAHHSRVATAWLAQDLRRAVTERDESLRVQKEMFQLGQVVSAELSLPKVAQAVAEAATSLSRAQLGLFSYKTALLEDARPHAQARSGSARDFLADSPLIQELLRATLASRKIFRSEDVSFDPLCRNLLLGRNVPRKLRSLLAAPVVSSSGEAIGAILLGHQEAGAFPQEAENLLQGLATQAAIAVDNARLFQKANEAIAIRDEFLSICSHELRTPLTALKLQNQLLARAWKKSGGEINPEQLERTLHQADLQLNRITHLVEDMLDISRIRSGRFLVHPERVNLKRLVTGVVDRLGPQLLAARTSAQIRGPESVNGNWDRQRLDQLVNNLLANAMKYGSGQPILVELGRSESTAWLAIEDRGVGIPKELHERIFERYERAQSSTNITGLGLGLYIVKQIVDIHGGRVRVESEPGKGSRFIVELPLHFFALEDTPENRPVA